MKRWYSIGVMTIAAWVLASGFARAGSGFYLSSEMGANFTPNVDINGTGYDGPSDCDEYINPLAPQDPKCAAQGITQWMSNADGASGILAGVAVGYRLRGRDPGGLWDHFRLELEYFYRESEYNQTSPVSATGGRSVCQSRRRTPTGGRLDRQPYVTQPVREPVLRLHQRQPFYPLRRVWGRGRLHERRLRKPLGADQRPGSHHNRQRPIQRGSHQAEPCRHDQQRPDGTQRHAVRLPDRVRGGLRADGIGLARCEGSLGQLRPVQRYGRLEPTPEPSAQPTERRKPTRVRSCGDRRHQPVRRHAEPQVPFLESRRENHRVTCHDV